MVKITQKEICLTMLFIFIFSSICFSSTDRSAAWEKMDKENYTGVVSELSEKTDKTAEEYYLLGKAYHKLGKDVLALENWKECNLMVQKLSPTLKLGEKYKFIFPPNKTLTAKEKAQIYNEFQTQFNGLVEKTKEKLAEKQEKQIAKADKLREKADAVSGKSSVPPKKEWKSTHEFPVKTFFIVLFGLLGFVVVAYGCYYVVIIIPKRRREKEEHERQHALEKEKTAQKAFEYDPVDAEINKALGEGKPNFSERKTCTATHQKSFSPEKRTRIKKYNVPHNNAHYSGGPFFYDGRLFTSEEAFFLIMHEHYTNAMYLDNLSRHHHDYYDPAYGHGFIGNAREFDYRTHEAAHLEAMADKYEELAEENQQKINDLEEMEMPEATPDDFEDYEMPKAEASDFEEETPIEEKDSDTEIEEVEEMPEAESGDFEDDEMPAKETDLDTEKVEEMPEPENNDFEGDTGSGG